jgi:hypothetical protein
MLDERKVVVVAAALCAACGRPAKSGSGGDDGQGLLADEGEDDEGVVSLPAPW